MKKLTIMLVGLGLVAALFAVLAMTVGSIVADMFQGISQHLPSV